MKNKEKYQEEITNRRLDGTLCDFIRKVIFPILPCSTCKLSCITCQRLFLYWLDEEYKEEKKEKPVIDWSKVAVDTPILVKDHTDTDWLPRHFAKYENNLVYTFYNGGTSWTTKHKKQWYYAELPESEETK